MNEIDKGGVGSGRTKGSTTRNVGPKIDTASVQESNQKAKDEHEEGLSDIDRILGRSGRGKGRPKGVKQERRKPSIATEKKFIRDRSMNKGDEMSIEQEIDIMSKAMEFTAMDNPIEEIKDTLMELGPEGIKKALPDMTDENKELLGDILEEMSKSHKLPIDPPKKLVNVGGENYVEEQVGDDHADEDIFDAAVKEGDNEHKQQGGSHDLTQPIDWEGQMIKSLDEFTPEELVTFGEVYKAMKMKKEEKEMDKAVSASPKLWGTTKPRGVGIYKGEEDDTVAEDVKEIKGKKTVKDVMEEAAPDKKDNILAELRDSKMKKAKELIKAAMKKECADMEEGKAELMKNKMRKALMEVLSEEYTDEEIEKAMKKGEEGKEIDIKIEAPSEDKKEEPKEEAPKVEAAEEASEDKPEMEAKPDMEKKMKKALELISKSKELLEMGEKDLATEVFLKAKDMMAVDIPEAKQVNQSKSEVGMNMGKGKLKQPELANEAKTTADAVKAPKMAKSVKWYGEENDAFKAGRLGRHSYASSVNEYYDDMIAKSEAPVQEEEPMKKSINTNDINDLIENEIMWHATDIKDHSEFKKSDSQMGNYTMSSFDDADMLKSLNISEEEAEEALGKSEYLAKAKFIRKIGSGKNTRYIYQESSGEHKVYGGKRGDTESGVHAGKGADEKARIPNWSVDQKNTIKNAMTSVIDSNKGKWVGPGKMKEELLKKPELKAMLDTGANEYGRGQDLGPQAWTIIMNLVKENKKLDTKLEGNKRYFKASDEDRKDDSGLKTRGKKAPPAGSPQAILQAMKKR